jgi:M-phase phosphoprotein 6
MSQTKEEEMMWKPGAKRPRPDVPQQLRTAKLSGATMNMRFMKRSTAVAATVVTKANSAPESTTATGDAPSNRQQQQDEHAAASDGIPRSATPTSRVEIATPLDMYGRDQSTLLGRRSFGGFNPITAQNWYYSRGNSTNRNESTGKKLSRSDRDLVHQSRANQPEGRRKKTPRQGLSNKQPVKSLDDVLMEE